MLPLSDRFTVIAVDPRGAGLSDKPADWYDTETLAGDMFALMDALGHQRFAMVGYDIGMWVGFVMAADCPERITRVALGEAIIPGLSPSPPLLNCSDDRLRFSHRALRRLGSGSRRRYLIGRHRHARSLGTLSVRVA